MTDTSPAALADLVDRLRAGGRTAGLAAVGVAPARPMHRARAVLEDRKAEGLHGGMAFTYRNPVRSTTPEAILPGAAALVVGALGYDRLPQDTPGAASPTAPVARVARYAVEDFYGELRRALGELAALLAERGWQARVVADDNALVDREAAYLAGIGWYGKNANILIPGVGSWVVLGSVVTDAPLVSDTPVGDGCGPCRRCQLSCPTGALVSPGVLDARRCLAWLVQAAGVFPREYRIALGDRLYGCDDCQTTCPVNLRARRTGPAQSRASERSVDVLALLAATDETLLARFGRWYIPRREPRYLRRNALIVLGNVGDGGDPAVEAALRSALASADPVVRAHAVWAAARVGRDDLLRLVAAERDPLVVAELAAAPEVPRRGARRVIGGGGADPAGREVGSRER